MIAPIFNKYGVGIPISDDYLLVKSSLKLEINKWLVDNFSDDFKFSSLQDLPKNYYDYYWIKWGEDIDESLYRAECRKDLHTNPDCIVKDLEEYYSEKDKLESYAKSYLDVFPYKYIINTTKECLGDFYNKKILVLGCGTGECISLLQGFGFDAYGIELNVKAFNQCNLAFPKMMFGDFLVDTLKIPNKFYDVVFTNMLSFVSRKDVLSLLIEINRIGKLFIQHYWIDGTSYHSKSKDWWHKKFNESGMSYYPSTIKKALCNEVSNAKCNSTTSKKKSSNRK